MHSMRSYPSNSNSISNDNGDHKEIRCKSLGNSNHQQEQAFTPQVKKKLLMSISAPPPRPSKLPVLQPARPSFVSMSVPCSASSSPRSVASQMRRLHDHRLRPIPSKNSRQLSSSYFRPQLSSGLLRSKSCGDGRSSVPPNEFGALSNPSINRSPKKERKNEGNDNAIVALALEKREKNGANDHIDAMDDEKPLKCPGLCVFISKRKPVTVKHRKDKSIKHKKAQTIDGGSVSRSVSLENFKCESWASFNTVSEQVWEPEKEFYELPTELIIEADNDVQSPVSTTFDYEEVKGGLGEA